ncbi:NADH-ubiquinone oxidoreductase 75 kDa subunit, mitochondrial-like [Colias croceus]|uniref:NADH-ubiquinone oxidoreductase 75 kDa subunit, mitochondrial-like n=1 Tax=Colias crocea TaxID=72248 RepID=UPI001E27F304|nr:NADH-ubiquinone oxidoreductase 75 kDa subunit, mitochondrial-like [Colias croceus]
MLRVLNKLLTRNVTNKIQKRTKSDDVPIFINGKTVSVPKHFTILQALRREGVAVPTFCYHDRLSIAGNCRMCLVEVEGMFKPQIACAMPIMKNMKVWTNTDITQRAQESVLEFLLINHPLDCPICDQGGECDLQDLSMKFGNDRSRFTDIHFEGKRAVEDKYLGPLIRTEMTRCIQCTRCIRFASQVCGMDVLGTTGRGTDMLVGTYVDKMFLSEMSGNIIDLCPVGALTAIPYMFKARPWEIQKANSIDVTDATGTNIVLNYRFNRVLRVLPREHEEINQEWVSDKGRWSIDSLEMQRLVSPMTRSDNCLIPIEWKCALKLVASAIKSVSPGKIMAIAGPYCNAETLVVAKDYLNILGCENTYIERDLLHLNGNIDLRASYSLNVKMNDVAKADKILLVGTNPRFEAPILNTWIRLAYTHNECDVYVIGPQCEYNYYVNYIGQDVNSISKAKDIFKSAKMPLIFVGIDQLESQNAGMMMSSLYNLASGFKGDKEWGVLNIVTREASFAAALECGWKPGALKAMQTICPSVIISLGADDIFYKSKPPKDSTTIYIGFQGDVGSEIANIILPGCAFTESGGTFLNMECRSQFAMPAVTPPGKARYDWKIIRALAEYSGICLFYSDAITLCCRMAQISPNFVNFGPYQHKLFAELVPSIIEQGKAAGGPVNVAMKELQDYYCSNIYTCNSLTMLKAMKAVAEYKCSDYAAN